jgi:hypothetical protein
MPRWSRLASIGIAVLVLGAARLALAADTTPPVIEHTPVTTVTRGETLIITAHMKDQSEIFGPTVWYRPVGKTTFLSAEMIRKTEDIWGAAIPATGDIEYYIEAYDEFGNGPSRAGGPDAPFHVSMVEPAPLYKKAPVAQAEAPIEGSAPAEPPAAAPLPPPKAVTTPAPAPTRADTSDDLSLPSEPATSKSTSKYSDDIVPESLALPATTSAKVVAPTPGPFTAKAEQPSGEEPPVYTRWWFITGVTVVGVAAITTAVILLQPQTVNRNVFSTTLQTPQ